MNILLIIVIAILLIGLIVGMVRGFTNLLFETATTFVSIIAAVILCSPIAKAVMSTGTILSSLSSKIYGALKLGELVKKFPTGEELLKNVNLPEVITNKIANTIDTTAGASAPVVADTIAQFVAKMIIYIGCFLALVLVVALLMHVLDHFFDLVTKIPGIKEVNKLLGAVVGFVFALLIVWLCFAIITLLGSTAFGAGLLNDISNNWFLSFLYNNNLPMQIITKKVEGLF